jgi:ANTAR domain
VTATVLRTEHQRRGQPGQPLDTVVEQAKGVLMLRYGIGSYESLATLAQWSHDTHLTLPELSRALVKGICQGHAGPRDRGVVRWLEHRLREEVPGQDTRVSAPPAASIPKEEVLVPDEGVAILTELAEDPTEDAQAPGAVPDVTVRQRWRYASAVHAARALHRS